MGYVGHHNFRSMPAATRRPRQSIKRRNAPDGDAAAHDVRPAGIC
jgi:hypothetical protein